MEIWKTGNPINIGEMKGGECKQAVGRWKGIWKTITITAGPRQCSFCGNSKQDGLFDGPRGADRSLLRPDDACVILMATAVYM